MAAGPPPPASPAHAPPAAPRPAAGPRRTWPPLPATGLPIVSATQTTQTARPVRGLRLPPKRLARGAPVTETHRRAPLALLGAGGAAWQRGRDQHALLEAGSTARRGKGGATIAFPLLSLARRGKDAPPSLSLARAARRGGDKGDVTWRQARGERGWDGSIFVWRFAFCLCFDVYSLFFSRSQNND